MIRSLRFLIFTWSVLMALVAVAIGCGSSEPTLSSIEVTPTTASIAKGATKQYMAMGKYSDDTSVDITSTVVWSSSDVAVATVSSEAANKGLATGVASGSATIKATLEGISGSASLTVTDTAVTLTSIAVTPQNPSIAKGTKVELLATGTYSDGTSKDVTGDADWSTSNGGAVTVDKGVAVGLTGGSAIITAQIGDVKGTTTVIVTNATLDAIDVSSTNGWVPKGTTEQFKAVGVFSDDTRQDLTKQVVWGSSNACVTISNEAGSMGLATGVCEGVTTISATFMNITGSRTFQVTSATLTAIEVTPFDPVIAKGTSVAFTATGVLSDHSVIPMTPYVVWSSSDPSIAKFDETGTTTAVAKGLKLGKVTITASFSTTLSASTTLEVTDATLSKLSIVPLNPTIAKGTTLDFVAIGTFSDSTSQDMTVQATWGSSNTAVATVTNGWLSHGFAIALAEGTTTISATVGDKSDSTTLTVSPATLTTIAVTPSFPTIAKGTSLQLVATGVYSDKTTQDLTELAQWTSTDASVAVSDTGDSKGVATGVNVGSASVKAAFGGLTGATTVTVTSATLVSIEVTPPNPSIAKGTSVYLSATGIYSDNSTQDLTHWVAWTSSDAAVAVSNAVETHGLAFGMVQGSATVTATFLGGISGSTTVTVTAATLVSMNIEPDSASIAKGTTVQLRAIGTYTDNAKIDLTYFTNWSSSDPCVAISGYLWPVGLAVGVDVGTATITAHFGAETATAEITVTAATLQSLEVTPANATLAKGTALWMTAIATYTDGSTQDVSSLATWSSSDESKVVISNALGARGLATGVGTGTVTITADFGGKSATTTVTVTTATLTSITVTPAGFTLEKNATKQFNAQGHFTDGTTQTITSLVTWSTSDPSKAIVSNAIGSKGLVTGVGAGTVDVKAALATYEGSVQLTVTD